MHFVLSSWSVCSWSTTLRPWTKECMWLAAVASTPYQQTWVFSTHRGSSKVGNTRGWVSYCCELKAKRVDWALNMSRCTKLNTPNIIGCVLFTSKFPSIENELTNNIINWFYLLKLSLIYQQISHKLICFHFNSGRFSWTSCAWLNLNWNSVVICLLWSDFRDADSCGDLPDN